MDNKVKELISKIEELKLNAEKSNSNSEKIKALEAEIASMKTVGVEGNKPSITKAMYMKKLITKDYSNTDSEGGYLVPTEIATLSDLSGNWGITRKLSTIATMKSDVKNFPTANYTNAGVIGETSPFSTNSSAIGNVAVTALKLGNVIKQSYENAADITEADMNTILVEATKGVAYAEDDLAFNGDGSATYGSYTGLLNNTSIKSFTMGSGDTEFQKITQGDLSGMISAISSQYQGRGAFVFNGTMRSVFRSLNDSVNGLFWKPSGGDVETIWGYPVYYLDSLPGDVDSAEPSKAFGIFGAFDMHILGDRSGLAFKYLQELYAANGQVGYQYYERVGFGVLDNNAFCRILTAAS